jgi:hypothetical protein
MFSINFVEYSLKTTYEILFGDNTIQTNMILKILE